VNEGKDGHSFLSDILVKFREGTLNWADARHIADFSSPDIDLWEWFFTQVGKIRFEERHEPKRLKIYTPGKTFPAISVTGTQCELECAHCDKKYLHGMIQGGTEADFEKALSKLVEIKAVGALLSGGSTKQGTVPLLKYQNQIQQFKQTHSLHFNAHVGLVDFADAVKLKKIGIDTVSYDLIADPKAIHEVFHLDRDVEDYIVSYQNLTEAGLRVVPHLLVGANFGRLEREMDVIKILAPWPPPLLVLIAMIPPKNINDPTTPSIPFSHLTPQDIAKFFFIAKAMLPTTELSLGCMRPKGSQSFEMERWAFLAGASRMEIPIQKTISWAIGNGVELQYFGACCAVPQDLEDTARTLDIRGNKLAK
jgi:hypothetical protein